MVLADTGYWLALANTRDRWHGAAVAATRRLAEALVVTWPVITETCHLLLSRLGVRAESRFVEQMSRNVEIHEMGQRHLDAVHGLMEKYANLPMDLLGVMMRNRGKCSSARSKSRLLYVTTASAPPATASSMTWLSASSGRFGRQR